MKHLLNMVEHCRAVISAAMSAMEWDMLQYPRTGIVIRM